MRPHNQDVLVDVRVGYHAAPEVVVPRVLDDDRRVVLRLRPELLDGLANLLGALSDDVANVLPLRTRAHIPVVQVTGAVAHLYVVADVKRAGQEEQSGETQRKTRQTGSGVSWSSRGVESHKARRGRHGRVLPVCGRFAVFNALVRGPRGVSNELEVVRWEGIGRGSGGVLETWDEEEARVE